MIGFSEDCEIFWVFCIMLIERSVRSECIKDSITEHVTQFVVVHATVEAERRDDVDIVDSRLCGEVEYGFDNPLARVGTTHLW